MKIHPLFFILVQIIGVQKKEKNVFLPKKKQKVVSVEKLLKTQNILKKENLSFITNPI
jgi:hypothetical protein